MARTSSLDWRPGWRFGDAADASWLAVQARAQLWRIGRHRGLTDPLRLRWYDDLLVDLDLGSDFSRCLFVGGVYDPNEFTLLHRLLRPGMHFVDAGANLGLYSLFAARRVMPGGRVTSFEPSPRDYERLKRNLELNQLAGVEAHAFALSDRSGYADLHVAENEHEGHNTFGVFAHKNVARISTHRVRLAKLDDLVQEQGWPPIDVIKIDVEGSELAVLSGASKVLKEHRPVLLLELLDEALRSQGSSRESVLRFLNQADYRLFHFHPASGRLHPGDSDAELNALAVPRERELPVDVLHGSSDAA